ncbi:CAAX protease (plasmid) [Helicobacter sp. NHP21005]|uniref:hypothetical protein n=1 Tax=Helicobacter felistomachi TaxID=3040201 RepID=UPI002573E504|nr:hypothetical protein [Helicobacter sp. NHP21005]BEG58246.1 CAAX protease [Helicobacter sp. NHP21005]
MEKSKLILFFSQERLESYENVDEHFNNLRLIGRITPKLASIELILRNLLDFEKRQISTDWLRYSTDAKILNKIKKLELNGKLTHTQLLSKMSLGEIIAMINENVYIRSKIFNLQHFDFKNYDLSNRNYCTDTPRKTKFSNDNKAEIVMYLLLSIRNRCFHWENLLKTRLNKNKIYPRITTKFRGTMVGIAPQNIELFLDDVIKSFDNELLELIAGK